MNEIVPAPAPGGEPGANPAGESGSTTGGTASVTLRAGVAAGPGTPADPFANLARLRLSQNFTQAAGVTPTPTVIAVRKPHRQEFIRVHPGEEYRFETACFVDRETKEVSLVEPNLLPALAGEITFIVLFLAISRNSPVPFLWPCTLPGSDGRPNRWHQSAIESARLAETSWLKVASDMSAGAYVPGLAAGDLPEPIWPAMSMGDYIRLAFRDRLISDEQHPVIRQLRGLA